MSGMIWDNVEPVELPACTCGHRLLDHSVLANTPGRRLPVLVIGGCQVAGCACGRWQVAQDPGSYISLLETLLSAATDDPSVLEG